MHDATQKEVTSRPAITEQDRKKTVLVVEDDNTHRTLIEKILLEHGFSPVPADNGFTALSKIDSGQIFDLILMDWDMPGLNGIETVRAIRERQAQGNVPYIPVLAFTGNSRPGDREKCIAAGMDAYLPKDAWTPKWQKTLINNLQNIIDGNMNLAEFNNPAIDTDTAIEDFRPDAFDQHAFDHAAALFKEELPVTVKEYLEDARTYINDINQGLVTDNAEQVDCGSHPLKSNSLGFGLVSVSKAAKLINEIAIRTANGEDSLDSARIIFPHLEDAFVHAQDILRVQLRRRGF